MKSAKIYVGLFWGGYQEKKKGFCSYAKMIQEADPLAEGREVRGFLLEPLMSDTCVHASHQDWPTGNLKDPEMPWSFPFNPQNAF